MGGATLSQGCLLKKGDLGDKVTPPILGRRIYTDSNKKNAPYALAEEKRIG
jgi:hypothetical protein